MYRLLVVDDEPIIADGISEIFQGLTSLELDVYKAYSASEALEWMMRTRVDILVSDICMPAMDGLELLCIVRNNWPECRVIFLTGHKNFEYAYSAMKYKNVSYILKTEGYDRIINEVEKSISEIQKSINLDALISKAKNQVYTTEELIYREYFEDLLKGNMMAEDYKTLFSRGSDNGNNSYLDINSPIILIVGSTTKLKHSIPFKEKISYSQQVSSIMKRFFDDDFNLIAFEFEGKMVFFMQPTKTEPAVSKNKISEELNLTSKDRSLLFVKEMLERVQDSIKATLGDTFSFAVYSRFVEWGECAERYDELKNLIEYYRDSEVAAVISEKSEKSEKSGNSENEKIHSKEEKSQNTVEFLKKYIDKNIGGDLSLVKLGEQVYFNPSYLSRLFKEVTGKNIIDYIASIKIKKSKQLLELPTLKIQDVAEAIGYNNATNFIRFFRKMTGTAPNEYRELMVKQKEIK